MKTQIYAATAVKGLSCHPMYEHDEWACIQWLPGRVSPEWYTDEPSNIENAPPPSQFCSAKANSSNCLLEWVSSYDNLKK